MIQLSNEIKMILAKNNYVLTRDIPAFIFLNPCNIFRFINLLLRIIFNVLTHFENCYSKTVTVIVI